MTLRGLKWTMLLLMLGLAACSGPGSTTERQTWQVTDDLRVTELRPGVWMHTSWHVLSSGVRFPSNGLLVRDGDGLLLIDMAWGEAPTEALLDWTQTQLGLPVVRAFSTHWHDDRLGGAAVLEARGVPFYASPMTRQLASEAGLPLPDVPDVGEAGAAVAFGPAEVLYPGPGHTSDNTVVWLPAHRVLFGGCAIKSAAAENLGYTAEAHLTAWPDAIGRMQARYAEADLVVPGHGRPGGPDLLVHTLDLLAQ